MSLLKKALLSMFVDKNGRAALEAYRETQKLDRVAPAVARDGRTGDHPPVRTPPAAAPTTARSAPAPRPPVRTDTGGEMEETIARANVEMAQRAREAERNRTGDRRALIASAMATHRDKRQTLDELDDETRVKLTMMALAAFMGNEGTRH